MKEQTEYLSRSTETDADLVAPTGDIVEISYGDASVSDAGLEEEIDAKRGVNEEIIRLNSTDGDGPDDVEESSRNAFDVTDWRNYMKKPNWDPLDNGVPTYVLMVGVGVCVVVLSTLVKRFVGKRT